MKKLRKYIRKEIQSLHEQKSYPVPLELMDVMKDVLQMRPLKRYINNMKAVTNRQKEYGTVEKQIEFITEKGLEAWQTKVQEIKTKYPKESS